MSDSFITTVVVLIAAILIFGVPMISIAHRNDVLSTQEVQAAITEFIDEVRVTGKITQLNYDNLIERIYATRRIL